MARAIESLGEKGGVRSAQAIAEFVREGFKTEDEVRAARLKLQKGGLAAYKSMERVQRELDHLAHRESAGATGLGPQITAREHKLRNLEKRLETAKSQTLRTVATQDAVIAQRERCAAALKKILGRLKPDQLAATVGALRRALDVDVAAQTLLLVRVLRESGRKEVSPSLLEVFSHPKAAEQVKIEGDEVTLAVRKA